MARPTASSINFPKGWTGANMVTVPVGADGKVALYNYGGAAHAVIDVLGWYWSDTEQPLGSQLFPIGDPERVYDSRLGDGPLRNGDVLDLSDLVLGAPADTADIAEIVVNITAVGATKPGVLTAWSGVGPRPKASTVNYEPKVTAPNMAVVTAGHGASGVGLRIANTTSGSVHVVVDLVGIQFADSPYGLRFTPRATPTRILDTRVPTGLAGPFGPAQTRTVNASKVSGLDTWAIVANTTGIKPTKQTYLTTWSGEPGSQRPDASLLNVNPGVVRSASTYAFTDPTASSSTTTPGRCTWPSTSRAPSTSTPAAPRRARWPRSRPRRRRMPVASPPCAASPAAQRARPSPSRGSRPPSSRAAEVVVRAPLSAGSSGFRDTPCR